MSGISPDRRRIIKAAAAAVGVAALSPLRGLAMAAARPGLQAIELISFPGSYNVILWAAAELGFFAAEGLAVGHELTTTSMYLARKTVAGDFHIAIAAIDNVVAYNEGQGQVVLDRPADLFAFMNLRPNTVLPLLVQGDIATFDDLRGRTLAVDAISTGFSFVLRKILEVHGLGPEDYELVSVGNARDRLQALKAGDHAGAVLTPPFDGMAKAAGLKVLGSSADAFPQYQGTCFISTRRWANSNRASLVAFTRAVLRAGAWLKDPVNRAEAANILVRNMPQLSAKAAAGAVAGLAARLDPDLNMAGIETVLALRSQYAVPARKLDDPMRYIDLSYLNAAQASL
ncbi:MAG: ABC transporter substrate-binding protein [Proteobacteria bacterium]|nr:ABC transporter substrate-binding protein [Pseudomonadota bacterium]